MGCAGGQGYLLARPMSAHDVGSMLERQPQMRINDVPPQAAVTRTGVLH